MLNSDQTDTYVSKAKRPRQYDTSIVRIENSYKTAAGDLNYRYCGGIGW